MIKKTALVLFSDDFRIKDNPAFYYAIKNYDNIIPLYVYQEKYLGRNLGSAAKIFLYQVLNTFNNLLYNEYKVNLIIKSGNIIDIIKEISEQMLVNAIYFNDSYTITEIKNANRIKENFKEIDVKSFKAKLLFNPSDIKTGSLGEYYKVFTPFAKECLKNLDLISESLPKPDKIISIHNIKSIKIDELNLMPLNESNWHERLIKNWSFDYQIIEQNISNFIKNKITDYKEDRNFPSKNGNSNISPYLRFGMLSPRSCFNAILSSYPDIYNQFTLELLWREFAYHVMFYNQNIATQELKEKYKNFQWNNSENFLEKWQQGETGFEIVDAGMKELWHTGSMHNRVRMITASFLIKDLIIDWKLGEQWFWETLVDADPAVNPFSWQWIFGSGFDAAPYFRIFNPESQKDKFDPDGFYCKKWLTKDLKPNRVVEHDKQRKIMLERYKNLLSDI